MDKTIALAQINTIALDIEGNLKKALEYIDKTADADVVIFCGAYLCGGVYKDVMKKFPIIEQNVQTALEFVAKNTDKQVLMGVVKSGKESVAVIENGTVKIVSSSTECVNVAGLKTSFIFRNEGDVNPSHEAELIIDFTGSVSKRNSEFVRNSSLSLLAKLTNAYVIQVNRVGANDELSFDGASRIYDNSGKLVARAEFFKEDLLIIKEAGEIKDMPQGMEKEPEEEFTLNYECDLERTYLSLCQATRDYFRKNGLKRAVLGLSGGLDSTICAVILTDALGAENVLGVSMPSHITSDLSKQDAYVLAKNLGIEFREVPISPMVQEFTNALKTFDWCEKCENSYTMDNFQARVRATILFGISNEYKSCIPIATSDKSEAYMGYATINGDMSGGFAIILDVTKTKLFALGKWLNEHRKEKNAIPTSILEKRPGAELAINPKTGKPLLAEEALMPYEFLDEVIWRIEILHQSKEELKAQTYFYEKTHSVSAEEKSQWIDKFFYRMTGAICKANLMPVFPLIDEVSTNKKVYNAPITSKINYESIKL